MIIIVCVDEQMGIMFNKRRQSQDRILREKLLKLTEGHKIWLNTYSSKQFGEDEQEHLRIDEDFLEKANAGEYCFVESAKLLPYEERIEKILLCRWNRRYPADQYFDIPLEEHGWRGIVIEEFQGSSHEKITLEQWER